MMEVIHHLQCFGSRLHVGSGSQSCDVPQIKAGNAELSQENYILFLLWCEGATASLFVKVVFQRKVCFSGR